MSDSIRHFINLANGIINKEMPPVGPDQESVKEVEVFATSECINNPPYREVPVIVCFEKYVPSKVVCEVTIKFTDVQAEVVMSRRPVVFANC